MIVSWIQLLLIVCGDACNLRSGRIDALTVDLPVWRALHAEYPSFRRCAEQLSVENYGLIFDPRRPGLRDAFNAFLRGLRESGELARIQSKWLDGPESGKTLAPPP